MSSNTDATSPLCAVCRAPAQQFCSACKTVNYCSVEHQRQDWKHHKTQCRPFRIANDNELGRYLIATRDIQAGATIFTEAPLIVGPKWYLTEREEKAAVMPCVGCFTPCRMGLHVCPRCHWPACSPNCLGLDNPNLHGLECTILNLGPGPSSKDPKSLIDYYRSDALVVLKCLLLQRQNSKKWTELMDMQSHEEERIGSELQSDAERRIVSYLQKNFLHRLRIVEQKSKQKFLGQYDSKVMHRICGIIETNYMCINLPTGMELSGVYYTACMMEHSCIPNCYFSFDHRNNFKISVIAGRDIKKCEHLIIMYSNMLWGTALRQEHLLMTKHFQCKCERCSDPTELSTFLSGMLCVGDINTTCGGIQLPKNPFNLKTDWACQKCPVEISATEIRYILTQMNNEIEDILARKPTIQQLETMIKKLSKFLHPNHYHMFNLKHSLIQLYGKEVNYAITNLSEAQLEQKMQMCHDLYNLCSKLDPHTMRLSIYVGIILFEMQTVLVERGHRLLINENKTDEDLKGALQYFQTAYDHLFEAAKKLRKELNNVAGDKLTDTVLKSMADLQQRIEETKSANNK